MGSVNLGDMYMIAPYYRNHPSEVFVDHVQDYQGHDYELLILWSIVGCLIETGESDEKGHIVSKSGDLH